MRVIIAAILASLTIPLYAVPITPSSDSDTLLVPCLGGRFSKVTCPDGEAPVDAGLVTIGVLNYQGAFRVSGSDYGTSSVNYSTAVLGHNPDNNSLFISGHIAEGSQVGEFSIPALVADTSSIANLNTAANIQSFYNVKDGASYTAPGGMLVNGLLYKDGELLVSVLEDFDNAPYQTDTTIVFRDADNLATSAVSGYHKMEGAARAAGYMSPIPTEWQAALGGTYLSGYSGGDTRTINARHSIGPSGFVFNPLDIIGNGSPSTTLATTEAVGYSLDHKLADDLNNSSGTNTLWTNLSEAGFGFIIPNTRTFAVFGFSGGNNSGVGYGTPPYGGNYGYWPNDQNDEYNYYWFFDVDDLVAAKNGSINPYDIVPYAYGQLEVPFDGQLNQISSGTFDEVSGKLYLSLYKADYNQGNGINPPIIIVYTLDGE